MSGPRSLYLAGDLLIRLRQRLGWSQEKLAAEADVNRNTVARMESGGGVYPKSARRVAEALRVPLGELIATPPDVEAELERAEALIDESARLRSGDESLRKSS